MCILRIGGEEAEYLTLTIHGRNFPNAADYWDGNWLSCTADVSAGAFHGSIDALLRNEDLGRFLSRLVEVYERLDGEALFDTLEGWLNLRIIGNRQGHMEARGQLRDDLVNSNILEFRLFFDQTFLPPIIGQLRVALEQFPVVGQR